MTPTQLIQSATRPGFVPVAQVTRGQLVALATKAMAALEEFMEALTPPAPVNMGQSRVARTPLSACRRTPGHRSR
jgi:hypothetical protein